MMQTVDEQPETIHLYVVREKAARPPLLPIFLSVVALSALVAVCALTPYQQPVTRLTIRVPAVLLPLKTFTATTAIIPTGVKVFPATTAHGVLTITNGSVIAQVIPAGFTVQNVMTDKAVYVPSYMHVTGVRIIGKNLLLTVWFVARLTRLWVK